MNQKEILDTIEKLTEIIDSPTFSESFKATMGRLLQEKKQQAAEIEWQVIKNGINKNIVDKKYTFNPFDLSYDLDEVSSSDIGYRISGLEKIPAESLNTKVSFITFLNDGGLKDGYSYTFPRYFFYKFVRTHLVDGEFAYTISRNRDATDIYRSKWEAEDTVTYYFEHLADLYEDLYDTIRVYVDDYNDFIENRLPDLEAEQDNF